MTTKNSLTVVALSIMLLLNACGEANKKTETQNSETSEVITKAPVYDTNNPSSVLASVAYTHGGWDDLWSKNDVQYTYDYRTADNKADVSTERYVFGTEASFGHYTQHDINAMPDAKGNVTQYFDGKTTTAMLDDKIIEDPQALGVSEFLRRANYFWFVMPYKLNDEGILSKYMGTENYNDIAYDKIEVTYDPAITGKEQNDIYILYVNPTTKIIDRFFFSLPFLGVNEPVIIANYEYEDIDGQKIATQRRYFLPNEKGDYGDTPSIVKTLTNISFNNGFKGKSIMKMN